MADEKPFHNPFSALSAIRDTLPPAPVQPDPPVAAASAPTSAAKPTGRTYARAVVRMERSGRGGKEATVIEQLQLTARERESWLKALKSALGCGGSIEDDTIMLQGDQRERLKRILADRGVKKVIVG
jgi:translation initiation factor 1